MNKSSNLYTLIHSLSKNEKRFFKLNAKLYHSSTDQNYKLLFEVLEKMQEYDKEELIKKTDHFVSEKSINALNVYLKDQILQALKLFHRKKNKKLREYDDISSVYILIDKKQYEEAQKKLTQLDKKYTNKFNYHALIDVYSAILKIEELTSSGQINSYKKRKVYFKKMTDCIENIQEELITRNQHNELCILLYDVKLHKYDLDIKIRAFIKKIIQEHETKKVKNHYTTYRHWHNLHMAYDYLGDFENAALCINKILEYNNQHSERLSLQAQCLSLINAMTTYTITKNKDKFLNALQSLSRLLNIKGEHQLYFQYWRYVRELEFYYTFHEDSIPESLINNINNILTSKVKTSMKNTEKNGLCFALAQAFFIRRNYAKALNTLDKVVLNNHIQPEDFYFLSIKTIQIICLYELSDNYLLELEVAHFRRKLQRDKINSELILIFINKIKKLSKRKKEKTELYREIHNLYHSYPDSYLPKQRVLFIQQWLEIKLPQ